MGIYLKERSEKGINFEISSILFRGCFVVLCSGYFAWVLLNVVWAHTLEMFAVNRIPTSGSLYKVWPLVFFIDQLITWILRNSFFLGF